MRALVQRVQKASVRVNDTPVGSIDRGLLVFVGIHKDDTQADLSYIVKKVLGLRIFEDGEGKMNLSVGDVGGSLLVVSQFTLYGDGRKGNRPSFSQSAPYEAGKILFDQVLEDFKASGLTVQTGVYGADMQISLINDGPVTIQLDSSKLY